MALDETSLIVISVFGGVCVILLVCIIAVLVFCIYTASEDQQQAQQRQPSIYASEAPASPQPQVLSGPYSPPVTTPSHPHQLNHHPGLLSTSIASPGSPGAVSSPVNIQRFVPYISPPRAGGLPYERLVLISSLVHNAMSVAAAALPDVAVIAYDYHNCTFLDITRYMTLAIGTTRMTSIAVIAPGSVAGSIGIISGQTTTAGNIKPHIELSQFWKVLAGCIHIVPEDSSSGRVDLLGCRVVEDPRDGAALLKDLWEVTSVPFAASDDALGGFQLSYCAEDPSSRSLYLASSDMLALDLYFDRYKLLGHMGRLSPAFNASARF